jgi:hypothetical protein
MGWTEEVVSSERVEQGGFLWTASFFERERVLFLFPLFFHYLFKITSFLLKFHPSLSVVHTTHCITFSQHL